MKRVKHVAAVAIPDELATALAADPKAKRAFASLPASHQREYVKWIDEAKKMETRQRRSTETARMLLVPAAKFSAAKDS